VREQRRQAKGIPRATLQKIKLNVTQAKSLNMAPRVSSLSLIKGTKQFDSLEEFAINSMP
jgi:hypothetical protein